MTLTQEQLDKIRAQYFFPGPCPVCGEKRISSDYDSSYWECPEAFGKFMSSQSEDDYAHLRKSTVHATPDRRIIHLVMEYEALVKEKRECALTELTQMSQEMGLYDDD